MFNHRLITCPVVILWYVEVFVGVVSRFLRQPLNTDLFRGLVNVL